jgi:hypothetical protein
MTIKWDGANPIANKLLAMPNESDKALRAIISLYAPKAESAMKTGATWTDRTSNARNGLFAKPVSEKGKRYAIVLAHTVNYGIWLEIRHAGRYAIILPTTRTMSPVVMTAASRLFAMIFGGI